MRQSKRSTSVSRCHTYSTGWWSTWEMTWWKSMSLHVPGQITTPNRMHPPLPMESRSHLPANRPDEFYYASQTCTRQPTSTHASPVVALHHLAGVVLDHRVGEELPAHLVEPVPRPPRVRLVEREVEDLADAHVAHLGEAQSLQCAPDGRSLRVEHARTGPDRDSHLPARARSDGTRRRRGEGTNRGRSRP